MLKPENEATCEGKYDLTATLYIKELEDRDPSLHSLMDDEASTIRNQFDSECADALLHNPANNAGLIEEETKLDKSTQIEPPEIIVFSKDDTCPIVKDICLDEGLYSLEEVLLENSEVSEKTSVSATNRSNDLNGKMTDGVSPVMQDSKFISAVDKVTEDQNCSWSLFEVGEEPNTVDQVKSDSFVPKISIQALPSPGESDRDHCHVDPTSVDFSSDHRQCIDQEKTEQTKTDDTCSTMTAFGATESEKSSGVNENPTNDSPNILGEATTDMTSDSTTSNHSGTEGNPANGEVEIRLNNPTFESGAEATTAKEERRGNADGQEFLQVQNHSVSEVTVPDAATTPARSSFYHNNHGDLNFSGPKVSSGHIANFGSISMRSDSSTTSTRSFAFPILQTEWNTSPVKMAKARKPRCWRMGLICCKF